jgi:ribonuclease J
MVKFIAISGTTGVTENLYVYESGNDMIIVDCGVGFPEADMYGVDLVIPDFTYIKENAKRLRGIFITHGHEDHLGALPFLLKEISAPIYCTKLVAGFIEDKFLDNEMEVPEIHVLNPEKDSVNVGVFRVIPFRVSHSVPDSVGFCIDSPEGKMFHIPDYKFDWTPVDGKPFDIKKLAILASDAQPLSVASDCLGSTSPGYTESERKIEDKIELISREAVGAIYFTTISSNISRMQQAIDVAGRLGRKVLFVGRSMDRKAEIARELGYLKYPEHMVIHPKSAKKLPRSKVMYIISGSYGQPGSALYRVALGEHQFLKVEEHDAVIFSGDPAPPGSKQNVDYLVDRLIEAGVDVHYYDVQDDLHVSGHGSQEDIRMLLGILKPKYYIPIGGTIRHMRAYRKLVGEMGVMSKDVFELSAGDSIEFKDGQARLGRHIPVKEVLVDGLGIGDVGDMILRDRHILSNNGFVIVLFQYDRHEGKLIEDPEIISRGFMYGDEREGLYDRAAKSLMKTLSKKNKYDAKVLRSTAIDVLDRLIFAETKRRPMILPVVVEV